MHCLLADEECWLQIQEKDRKHTHTHTDTHTHRQPDRQSSPSRTYGGDAVRAGLRYLLLFNHRSGMRRGRIRSYFYSGITADSGSPGTMTEEKKVILEGASWGDHKGSSPAEHSATFNWPDEISGHAHWKTGISRWPLLLQGIWSCRCSLCALSLKAIESGSNCRASTLAAVDATRFKSRTHFNYYIAAFS